MDPKERPILFQGWKVKLIQEWDFEKQGDMQTRRVIRPQPSDLATSVFHAKGKSIDDRDWKFMSDTMPSVKHAVTDWFRCPYGVPGDLLYVRENWQALHWTTDPETGFQDFDVADHIPKSAEHDFGVWTPEYQADGKFQAPLDDFKWRPSIHMPKWACRLKLDVTDVRVERVQDISEEDAKAEGISWNADLEGWCLPDTSCFHCSDPITSFMQLWDSINEKRGFGWDVNPWVWVVSFKRKDQA